MALDLYAEKPFLQWRLLERFFVEFVQILVFRGLGIGVSVLGNGFLR
jgi:hypothetical protein